MPTATGENWEKYKKNYDDEEEEEKKIQPLTDEFVIPHYSRYSEICLTRCVGISRC